MLRILFACCALVASVTTQRAVKVTPCADPGKGQLEMLTATPCHSHPCEIAKGGVITFDFEFVPDQNSKAMQVDAHVSIFGFRLRIPGLEPDLCKSTVRCPIRKGEHLLGRFNMSVPRVPIRHTTVEVNIWGDHGMMACFTHPIQLK